MRTSDQIWDVIPFVPLPAHGTQSFSYRAPEELLPGMLVRIPFGSRRIDGLVWKPSRTRYPRARLKPITKILSTVPLFTLKEISVLEHLANLSLKTFPLIAKAAALVRAPLKTTGIERAAFRKNEQRGARLVQVRWEPLAEVLPKTLEGQVLILTAEAAMARETLRMLEQRGLPALLFAQVLPVRQRRAIVERLAQGEPLVVVATHAGVFLPFQALTEIIVAEAALRAHRQWDLHPRYDARVASLLLARNHQVPLTLQSTLPSLELHHLQPRASWPKTHAQITVVPRAPSDPLLSETVLSAVRTTLDTGGTAFLFHDIVGTEYIFTCRTCGFVLRCSACAGLLERSGSALRCRVCSVPEGRASQFCPHCKSPHIGPRRIGTATLAGQLRRAFQSASIHRADRETLPRTRPTETPQLPKGSIVLGTERAFAALQSTTFDRIIIVDADRILESASFDAAEHFASLVIRLARYGKPGADMLLQTTHPHLSVIRALAGSNLTEWITEESSDRELLGYPPYAALLHLQKSFPAILLATHAAEKLVSNLGTRNSRLTIGYRVRGISSPVRAEIVLRGPLEALQSALANIPSGWSSNPQIPLSLLR